MMVLNHDRPLVAGQLDLVAAHRPVRRHARAGRVAAVDVDAGVGGILEHRAGPGVGERAEAQLAGPRPAVGTQREPSPRERGHHPERGAGLRERGEHVADRALDLFVRVDDLGALGVVDVADRQRGAQLAALRGRPLRRLQPARHDVQLRGGHRRFQAEQQLVVEVGQVVDPVRVDEQRVRQPGQFRQPGQVRVRPAQPGDLQPEDRPDLAQTQPGHQMAKPLPAPRRGPGQPQIRVDHLHVRSRPAQLHRCVPQGVLAQRRLGVLPELDQRRLTQVDQRRPPPMRGCDLVFAVHRMLPARWPSCSPPPQPPRGGQVRTERRRSSLRSAPGVRAARR